MRKAPLFAAGVALLLVAGIGYSVAMRGAARDAGELLLQSPVGRAVGALFGRSQKDTSAVPLATRQPASAPESAAPANAPSLADALPFSPRRPAPPLPPSGTWNAPVATVNADAPSSNPATASVHPQAQVAAPPTPPPLGAPPRWPGASSSPLSVTGATTGGPKVRLLTPP